MKARIARAVAVGVAVVLTGAGFGRSVGAAPGVPSARYIVVLRPSVDVGRAAGDHGRSFGAIVGHQYTHALRGYDATIPADRLTALEADPRVATVVPDRPVHATGRSTPSTQVLPTGVDRIDADVSTTRAGDGEGTVPVNVAVIDTGIDSTHPDLDVVGGVNCNGGGASYADQNGHGTHVAGTVGAKDNGIGVVGVVPGARLWAVRVLNKHGSGSDGDVLCGVDWLAGTRSDADPANDIVVANMSLGGPGTNDGDCGRTKKDPIHQAICAATAKGITVVAAAGNGGADFAAETPASYPEVLTVTAVTDLDGRPGGLVGGTFSSCISGYYVTDDAAPAFSDFATTSGDAAHTVAAPGVCINSTVPGGYDATYSGTSMASPHVAGTVALCIASGACSGLSPAQIIRKIRADALGYSVTHPGFGFDGDPLRPVAARYYGPLVRAGAY